jgi:hypothetical protein
MDVQDLKALRKQLEQYVSLYADCIKTAPSRQHLCRYVNGQVSDLERKNVEAIALDAGVPPRSLQEFLGIHRWDDAGVGTRVQHLVRERRVDENAKRARRPLQAFHIKDTRKGPVVWEARATRFFPWDDHLPGEQCWLIVARNVLTGEMKYFLSNAPKETALETMLHIAFSRAAIERLFQDSKGEVGLDHFEVRRYTAVMRHLILSMVSMLFLAEQTQRLRGGKSGLDDLPGPQSHRSATGSRHQRTRADPPTAQVAGEDPVLADAQHACCCQPPQAPVPGAEAIGY